MLKLRRFRAVDETGRIQVHFSEKSRQEWIARDPARRRKVLRSEVPRHLLLPRVARFLQ